MEDPTAKRIASTSGGGGGGGDKPPSKLSATAKPFVMPPPKPPVAYSREFETVAQQQQNAWAVPLGYARARSFSIGVFDPTTNMRTQRAHYHMDAMRPDAGAPIAKPDAAGQYGGVFTSYTSTPVKK